MNRYNLSTMVGAAVMLAGCAAAPRSATAETPLQMSMSEILKDPWRYDGKLVRVRGTFDECASLTCRFCEAARTFSHEHDAGACMGVSFDSGAEVLEPAGSTEHVRLMSGSVTDLAERNARFTTSTVDAYYDAACSGVLLPPEPDGTQRITVCSDRASQLIGSRIVQVHIRRPATAGRISMYFADPVIPASDEEAEKLKAAFLAASSANATGEEATPSYFYVWKDRPAEWLTDVDLEAAGGACICLLDDCAGIHWPRRFGDAMFDVPANPYKCWLAERRGGVWKFPLQ